MSQELTSFGPIVRTGMLAGTTSISPLAAIIKKFKPGFFQMLNPRVCSHIALSVMWDPCYAPIIVDASRKWGCAARIPECPAGTLLGIEATWPRCRWFPLHEYELRSRLGPHYVFIVQPHNVFSRSVDEINQFLWSYVGKPYELEVFLQMYGVENSDPQNKRAYCSEIGLELLDFIGAPHEASWKWGIPPIDMQLHYEATKETLWKCYTGNWCD